MSLAMTGKQALHTLAERYIKLLRIDQCKPEAMDEAQDLYRTADEKLESELRMEMLSDMLHTYCYGGAGQAVSDSYIAEVVERLEQIRRSL